MVSQFYIIQIQVLLIVLLIQLDVTLINYIQFLVHVNDVQLLVDYDQMRMLFVYDYPLVHSRIDTIFCIKYLFTKILIKYN